MVAADLEHSWGMRPPPKRMTQSVTFGPDSEFHLASTGGCTRHPRPSPTLCRQFPTWIHLGLRVHTWSPNVIRVWSHPSALCMHGLRRPPRRADFFSTTTSRLRLITRAAASATGPCAGSRLSPFSWTPVPSTLAMARQEEVERLEAGAPNPRHPAAQVPWYRRTYHEIRDITWLWYQKLLISEGHFMDYMLWYHVTYHKILISEQILYEMYMISYMIWHDDSARKAEIDMILSKRVWYHKKSMISYMISYDFDNIRVAQERQSYDIIYDIIVFLWYYRWYHIWY